MASRFGRVANTGQHENMHLNSMILHVWDAIVANSIHKATMPLNAVAHLLQMEVPSFQHDLNKGQIGTNRNRERTLKLFYMTESQIWTWAQRRGA